MIQNVWSFHSIKFSPIESSVSVILSTSLFIWVVNGCRARRLILYYACCLRFKIFIVTKLFKYQLFHCYSTMVYQYFLYYFTFETIKLCSIIIYFTFCMDSVLLYRLGVLNCWRFLKMQPKKNYSYTSMITIYDIYE